MTKTAALRIRIDPELHRDFLEICKQQDTPASHILRQFMRDYVQHHMQSLQADFFETQSYTK